MLLCGIWVSLELFLSSTWTKASFIECLRGYFTSGGLFHIVFEYLIGLYLLVGFWQRILTRAILEVPAEKLVWCVCRNQEGLAVFSNKFPYSFYGNKMPLPASPGPFLGGHRAGSVSLPSSPLVQPLLAVAQNTLPDIFSLEHDALWISFPYVFLGKYLPFLLCLRQFAIPDSAHDYLSSWHLWIVSFRGWN